MFNQLLEIKKYNAGNYKYITNIITEEKVSECHKYRN